MSQRSLIWLLGGATLLAVVVWVANNTHWEDSQVPMPPKGEALTNPSYAAQRFTEALGARPVRARLFTVPAVDSVIVLSDWNWDLSATRRKALETWVESGGRLVADRTVFDGSDAFEHWTGIAFKLNPPDETQKSTDEEEEHEQEEEKEPCRLLVDDQQAPTTGSGPPTYSLCNVWESSHLTTRQPAAWALRDASGIHVVRTAIGRGSVTVINAAPFRYRNIFDGDHGRLFAAATDLRRGDAVHFLSETDHPSLLALMWLHGRPAVVLALAVISLALWRGGVRFGPLATPLPAGRRSLAEQIRGSGRFALQHGSDDALHAACVRALDDAARRRIPAYARLSARDRISRVADLAAVPPHTLAAAIHHPGSRRSGELLNTIALLEGARRRILTERTR